MVSELKLLDQALDGVDYVVYVLVAKIPLGVRQRGTFVESHLYYFIAIILRDKDFWLLDSGIFFVLFRIARLLRRGSLVLETLSESNGVKLTRFIVDL